MNSNLLCDTSIRGRSASTTAPSVGHSQYVSTNRLFGYFIIRKGDTQNKITFYQLNARTIG